MDWAPPKSKFKDTCRWVSKKIFFIYIFFILQHKWCTFYTQSTTSLLLGLHAATLGPKSLSNPLEDYRACQDQWGDVLFNFPGVDKRPSPWSPSVQSAAEWCPSTVSRLQGSAGGGRQWGKGAQFGRMLTQPRRTPSWYKVPESQQFVRPADPRWMAGVEFIETPYNSAAARPLENTAVKREKRRAMRERIKAVWRTVMSLIIGTVGKWRKERRGFYLSHGFILHLNFVILLSRSLSPHFL